MDFTLVCGSNAMNLQRSDGIGVSSLFDTVMEHFGIVVSILEPIQLGSLPNIKGEISFNS